MSLKGKTLFITGASRGIGKAMALKAAQDGANIVVAAKTAEPHPKLSGTIYSAAKEIEAAGGNALPVVVDVRNEELIHAAMAQAKERFGGINILINNASAIALTGTEDTSMKRYDLMHSVNVRGTFLCSKLAIPYLREAENPHVLNLSPPLNMEAKWFKNHTAYTMAKFGMSMCVLGMAAEFKKEGIAFNALWPRTTIDTAAIRNIVGGESMAQKSRTPQIMADAAYCILTKDSKAFSGHFCIDDQVLKEAGISDFTQYQVDPNLSLDQLMPDFFV